MNLSHFCRFVCTARLDPEFVHSCYSLLSTTNARIRDGSPRVLSRPTRMVFQSSVSISYTTVFFAFKTKIAETTVSTNARKHSIASGIATNIDS